MTAVWLIRNCSRSLRTRSKSRQNQCYHSSSYLSSTRTTQRLSIPFPLSASYHYQSINRPNDQSNRLVVIREERGQAIDYHHLSLSAPSSFIRLMCISLCPLSISLFLGKTFNRYILTLLLKYVVRDAVAHSFLIVSSL